MEGATIHRPPCPKFGTVDIFLAAVEAEHGDNEHGRAYRDAVEFATKRFSESGGGKGLREGKEVVRLRE